MNPWVFPNLLSKDRAELLLGTNELFKSGVAKPLPAKPVPAKPLPADKRMLAKNFSDPYWTFFSSLFAYLKWKIYINLKYCIQYNTHNKASLELP